MSACVLVATTTVHAYTCVNGASLLAYVKFFGVNAATVTCTGIPGKIAHASEPEDPNDPAQAYFTQVEAQGKCTSASPCTAICLFELAADPFEGLNTLLGEQEARCKAAGGTYTSRIL